MSVGPVLLNLNVSLSAFMYQPEEMHEQELAVEKRSSLLQDWPIQRMDELMHLKSRIPRGL